MKTTKAMPPKAMSPEDYGLLREFETLRGRLLKSEYADRWEKPLAYWALPKDRRLPLAFLGRPLRELITTPFDELSATPGIGHKKIDSFVKLLERATRNYPPEHPSEQSATTAVREHPRQKNPYSDDAFEPDSISEALWSIWQETVRSHQLQNERIGRILPSLRHVPSVLWNARLRDYLDSTLAEIRVRKTHGEKRVRVILQAFYTVHQTLGRVSPDERVGFKVIPKNIELLENWLHDILEDRRQISRQEITQQLAVRLVEQVRIDLGDTVADLARDRLGLEGPSHGVREQATHLGLTRARVYQLLEDCGAVMRVRWPEGRLLMETLHLELDRQRYSKETLQLLNAACELFYPEKLWPNGNGHGGH